MGVIYVAYNLDGESRKFLAEYEIQCPFEDSRLPTPSEFKDTILNLENVAFDHQLNPDGSWNAHIERLSDSENRDGPWTSAWIHEFRGDYDPCVIVFEKGQPEFIVEILSKLATKTGTLILVPDTGQVPLLILPFCDVKKTISAWEI